MTLPSGATWVSSVTLKCEMRYCHNYSAWVLSPWQLNGLCTCSPQIFACRRPFAHRWCAPTTITSLGLREKLYGTARLPTGSNAEPPATTNCQVHLCARET